MARDKDRYSRDQRYEIILDNGEDPTKWSSITDTAVTIASGAEHITGARSVSFNKTTGGSDAYITRPLDVRNGMNLDAFSAEGQILSSVYLPSITDVEKINFTFTMSSGGTDNYIDYKISDTDLQNGWNHIKLDCNDFYSSAGCGIDWTKVGWVAFGVSFDNASDTLNGILIDSVRLQIPTSTFSFEPNIDNLEVTALSSVKVTDGTDETAVLSRTTGSEQPAVTDNALVVYDVSGGAASVSSVYRATTNGSYDGTVVYASATTLTLTGAPFTVNNEDIVYVREVDAAGNTANIWVNGASGVHFEISGTTVTRSGGNDFSATGEYELGFNGQDKGYVAALDAHKSVVVNPTSNEYVGETLAAVTNGTDATYYYYVDMSGYKRGSFQLILDGGSGTVTVTIEGTLQDDGTAAASCTYVDITNATFGAASYTSSDILADNSEKCGCYKYIRVKVVAASGSNDANWTIYHKRMY